LPAKHAKRARTFRALRSGGQDARAPLSAARYADKLVIHD
jgi:hypothetical protein